ncbi:tRNA glutamyl-Q(34) synthetase GluQRS [Flocculibacter collagenilyticus]|uniref:tRNA glutamyl-Q(34) synthetase GluQRS n=1 Tax=Flocculibacter collagenilyticus TaxID=2744479 RepID=UPI0018F581C5|nr:tRNA glutamyl-Q(34) synthetase GluQRS [Flocculibacter collagenilyticus]
MNLPITIPSPSGYRGRFAPSPSGPLHFGSLIAALGSFLQAKSQQGKWLVRIDDIDPPREQAGAASLILSSLEAFGLHWDESVVYQSQRHHQYDEVLTWLKQQGAIYPCDCTRKQIMAKGGVYDGTCKSKTYVSSPHALRLNNKHPVPHFYDQLRGNITIAHEFAAEDFIIHRKDGLYAYQLAVVVDDIEQGITEVVRGADLIEPTVRQLTLYQLFNAPTPSYIYLPLASQKVGFKLSKQNHAPALNNQQPLLELVKALQFFNLMVPKEFIALAHTNYSAPSKLKNDINDLLNWAIGQWSLDTLPKDKEIVV